MYIEIEPIRHLLGLLWGHNCSKGIAVGKVGPLEQRGEKKGPIEDRTLWGDKGGLEFGAEGVVTDAVFDDDELAVFDDLIGFGRSGLIERGSRTANELDST